MIAELRPQTTKSIINTDIKTKQEIFQKLLNICPKPLTMSMILQLETKHTNEKYNIRKNIMN